MTVRAIVGLVALNVLLAALGYAVLCALRPATTRKELLRLVGVAYLLGVAALEGVYLWSMSKNPRFQRMVRSRRGP